MVTTKEFHGVFARQLAGLVAEKKALGLKYGEQERILHIFDDLSLEFDCSKGLPKELVLAFVEKRPHWSQSTQEHRVSSARQIALYLNKHGIPAYMCDKTVTTKTYSNFVPYIFTQKQIAEFFHQVDNIKPNSHFNSDIFYPVVFRMLYGCGLRISEALALKVKDVDLSEGLLYVYDSKNHKDRVVPMDHSLTRYCKEYAAKIHLIYDKKNYFFKPSTGGSYNKSSVYHYYREILWKCGISHGGRSNGGPRLHDVRHTFCVHSLYQFLKNGIDHQAALPILSAYMGHSCLAATAKYLRLTAEAFPEITKQMETYFGSIIPELEVKSFEAD